MLPNVRVYKEGIFVGYRWLDAKGIEPLFPFGHGLSYTQFELADLKLECGGSGVSVSLVVINTGERAAEESSRSMSGNAPVQLSDLSESLRVLLRCILLPPSPGV